MSGVADAKRIGNLENDPYHLQKENNKRTAGRSLTDAFTIGPVLQKSHDRSRIMVEVTGAPPRSSTSFAQNAPGSSSQFVAPRSIEFAPNCDIVKMS